MSRSKFCLKSAVVWVLFYVTVMAHAAKDTDCSQTIMADRPVLIASNNGSKLCSYLITVPPETLPDHIFQVSLLSFNVGHRSQDGTACQGSFAQIGSSIYCGGPTTPGTFLLYPASKHRNQLSINLHPGGDNHQFQTRIELLPRLTLQEKHPEMILATPGEHIPYTECDRVYTCLEYPGYCQVTSPNYPSAYARAINCSYYFKSPEPGIIIGGRHELFEVGDGNKLSQNCDDNDYIAIYDGEELISKFCGKIKKFPKIISKSTDILIRFVSTKAGTPSKGFVLSVETSPPHLTDQASCFQSLKVNNMVQQLKSPHHWLAPNTHCSYTLTTKQNKQIWLFLTHIKTKSNCSIYDDYISIYDGNNLIMNYCKYNKSYKPIVSQSNQLKIVYNSPNGTLDATSKFYFIARFTAVNMIETGDHVENTWCDTIFSTKSSGPFSLLNPRDLILNNYSSKNLTCKYYFRAPESYTVRLQIDHTSFEPLHRCNSVVDSCILTNYDKLLITENYEKNILGCECGARKHAQIFQSKGSEMIVTLQLNLNSDLVNSSLKHSPELYQFQGRYSFIPPTDDSIHCGLYSLTHEALTFPTKHNLYVITPIMCHWKLKHIKYSDLKLLNLTLSNDCKNNYLIIQTENNDFKLCNDNHLSDIDLINDEVINIYLIANRGRPRLNLVWLQQGNDPSFINIVPNNEEECYGALTLSILMGVAALCTMTLALVVALVIWRYRTSLWLSTWRRQTSYSSVTRHTSGSFW